MTKYPLAEVFGFPMNNTSPEATRHRKKRLCPFNNKVPNCTKDKANDPLGVCSVFDGEAVAITCPVRFREDWLIADDAAAFFFAPDMRWTSLVEVRLNDKHGKSAGNVDIVLVAYDERGRVVDFGSLEIQAVYISGNVRAPFENFMQRTNDLAELDWTGQPNYPRPDYLSSSRKRLAPQLLFKGGIFHAWRKKQAVALHRGFYDTLPRLPVVEPEEADMAWLVYDLNYNPKNNRYELCQDEIIYTKFQPTMLKITTADPGNVTDFVGLLQSKLDEKLDNNPPDAPILLDPVLT
ncbi:MAG: NotI family restriction endonuclease [Acidobacteriota bacterium]|nr:NotI family restriction endonuclease [Acidobacteriota bacterium]